MRSLRHLDANRLHLGRPFDHCYLLVWILSLRRRQESGLIIVEAGRLRRVLGFRREGGNLPRLPEVRLRYTEVARCCPYPLVVRLYATSGCARFAHLPNFNPLSLQLRPFERGDLPPVEVLGNLGHRGRVVARPVVSCTGLNLSQPTQKLSLNAELVSRRTSGSPRI